MDLTHEELEEYLLRIFTCRQLVYVNNICLIFKQPDNFIRIRANEKYKHSYARALEEGMLSLDNLEALIKERRLFTDEDQQEMDRLDSKLHAQKILLGKTVKVKANQDRIKGVIADLESQMNELKTKKYSKLMLSAETKAEEDRSAFLCWACTYKNEIELYWSSYEDLFKETNLDFKYKVISEFLRFYNGISTNLIRIIARSNLWRIRYITSLKVSEPLFGVPTSEYTNDMINLAYWSNFYQGVYEMMPEDRPPDSIIDDDDSLDAYMKDYYEERTREDASRRQRSVKGKLSAFDKEEVIVTQSNELYEDIKYDKPREAQKVKDRADLKKRTRRPR
jgi:hypothetical protein